MLGVVDGAYFQSAKSFYSRIQRFMGRKGRCTLLVLVMVAMCDFGLAKMLTSDDLASSVVGTPSYMCPELLADIPYGSKSDIWSLGCCIYEMMAFKPAFKAFDMQALINKINKSIVAPLPTMYSGAFRGLVKSMLRKNPETRPSDLSKPLTRKLSTDSMDGEKSMAAKTPVATRTPSSTPAKNANSRRKTVSPKLPVAKTPASRPSRPIRRITLPKVNMGLSSIESPDVSVDAPLINKMTEIPLASTEKHLILPVPKTSSVSTQCSSDQSIKMDHRTTVKIIDQTHTETAGVTLSHPCLDFRGTHRRFDTSSYQQRAEALEGLLEFSAQLMQQERIEELAVLLKPFGPEKASPRETAIWLSKSFKGITGNF
ncbi:hypothetical protein L1987_59570 [Smallanthus sonchifolius]|uniref:Uncharacterized protein n=1 Tax=Smallanthus sonchifolius TaxID=185202 RepID=A0ACB9D5K9_9ASTR|nr:hypothetical protein L1987_59570 [Smallanthus sonchifolius]